MALFVVTIEKPRTIADVAGEQFCELLQEHFWLIQYVAKGINNEEVAAEFISGVIDLYRADAKEISLVETAFDEAVKRVKNEELLFREESLSTEMFRILNKREKWDDVLSKIISIPFNETVKQLGGIQKKTPEKKEEGADDGMSPPTAKKYKRQNSKEEKKANKDKDKVRAVKKSSSKEEDLKEKKSSSKEDVKVKKGNSKESKDHSKDDVKTKKTSSKEEIDNFPKRSLSLDESLIVLPSDIPGPDPLVTPLSEESLSASANDASLERPVSAKRKQTNELTRFYVKSLADVLLRSVSVFPPLLQAILKILKQTVENYFPDAGYQCVCNFFFFRLMCPLILQQKKMARKNPNSIVLTSILVKSAKVLQRSNLQDSQSEESNSDGDFEDFILEMSEPYHAIVDSILQPDYTDVKKPLKNERLLRRRLWAIFHEFHQPLLKGDQDPVGSYWPTDDTETLKKLRELCERYDAPKKPKNKRRAKKQANKNKAPAS